MRNVLRILIGTALLVAVACERNNPYDPESDDYQQVRAVKNLPGTATAFGFAALETALYMVGGQENGDGTTVRVYGYEPESGDRDTLLPDLPAPRSHCIAASYDGRMYVFGGKTDGVLTPDVLSAAPGDTAWVSKHAMPALVLNAAVAVLGNYIYVIGGETADGTPLASCYRYDPAADTWTAMAAMTTARTELAAAVSGGVIYAGGGSDGNAAPYRTVEEYDPAADAWTASDTMRTRHDSFIMAASNGYLFAMDSDGSFFEERDSTGGAWYLRDLADPDGFTTGSPAALIDAKIYFCDGNNIYQFLP